MAHQCSVIVAPFCNRSSMSSARLAVISAKINTFIVKNGNRKPESAKNPETEHPLLQNDPVTVLLWNMCRGICDIDHPSLLPCFSIADFESGLTFRTQNFIHKHCRALQTYNFLFGSVSPDELMCELRSQGPRAPADIFGQDEYEDYKKNIFKLRRTIPLVWAPPIVDWPVLKVPTSAFRAGEVNQAIYAVKQNMDIDKQYLFLLLRQSCWAYEDFHDLETDTFDDLWSEHHKSLAPRAHRLTELSRNLASEVNSVFLGLNSAAQLKTVLSQWATEDTSLTVVSNLYLAHFDTLAASPLHQLMKILHECCYRLVKYSEHLSDMIDSLLYSTARYVTHGEEETPLLCSWKADWTL